MRKALGLCALLVLAPLIGGTDAAARGEPCPFPCKRRPPLTDDQARAGAAAARQEWFTEIKKRGERGRAHPHPVHFRSPGRAWFLATLKNAAGRYHFKVLQVHFYKPLQLAPFVVVQSERPKKFSRATPTINRLLDPVTTGSNTPTAWAYEAFYLEARDPEGVPFLAVFSFVRGGIAGGQWARREELYPYPHG